jgi:hypothetical protein
MRLEDYRSFTDSLARGLSEDARVVGLVALGSMAEQDYAPDRWSDHDFFVVTRPGEQESFRTDLSWLPAAGRLAYRFRETEHGVKALYEDGHLVEFAVFDEEELRLARVNRYRVLLDRGGVAARLEEVRRATEEWVRSTGAGDDYLFGQLLTNALVGAGRYSRGERLVGGHLIWSAARYFAALAARYLPSPEAGVLDDLDPLRRFERAYPELGRELGGLLGREAPEAAAGLLRLTERELGGRAERYPSAGVAAALRALDAG